MSKVKTENLEKLSREGLKYESAEYKSSLH